MKTKGIRVLAAFESGYQCRLLRARQESVWASDLENVKDIDPCLEVIDRNLAVLGGGLSKFQHARYKELKTWLEDRHDAASVVKGQLLGRAGGMAGDAPTLERSEAVRHLRELQKKDWEELWRLIGRAVERDSRSTAWCEFGFALADLRCRVASGELPFPLDEAGWVDLDRAMDRLSDLEKAWVVDLFPSHYESRGELVSSLDTTYTELRDFITRFEERCPVHFVDKAADDSGFKHTSDFRACQWPGDDTVYTFNEAQAAVIRALYEDHLRGGVGLTVTELFVAADRKRLEPRLDHLFRDKRLGKMVPHPAWTKRLIISVGGGVYKLNLQPEKKEHKK